MKAKFGCLLVVLAGLTLPASSALAQADPQVQGPPAPPKIIPQCRNNQQSGEIVVCSRPERSPYRIPEPEPGFDPEAGEDSVSRERHRLYEVGETGIGSCSNVGAGGAYGCSFKRWKDNREQTDGHGRKKGIIAKVRGRAEPEPVPGN